FFSCRRRHAKFSRDWSSDVCSSDLVDRDNPGGAAGLVEFWTGDHWERRDYWLSEPGTTNSRMALRSAIAGLAALKRPCHVTFTRSEERRVGKAGVTCMAHEL